MEHLPYLIRIGNQLFDAEKKVQRNKALQPVQKNLERIRQSLEEIGIRLVNPHGEKYDELRTDCEASLAGDASKPLFISEVLKPIIIRQSENSPIIVQRAVVIVSNDRPNTDPL